MAISIPRRTLLRGAGACLALPLLEIMHSQRAAAQTVPVQRFIAFFYPNGTDPRKWNPAAGALTADTRAEFIYSGTNWILLATLTAPTPAANDDSSKIATTAWVHDEIQSIPGRTDGVAAATGDIGEYLEAGPFTLPAGSLPVATWVTPGSISLTAGDWDVWANVSIQYATNNQPFYAGLSETAATPDLTWLTSGYIGAASDAYTCIGPKRVNFTGADKIIHFVASVAGGANYGIGSSYIRARRRS